MTEVSHLLLAHADDAQVERIITAINEIVRTGGISRASISVACAQMLGETITGDRDVAADLRAGIHALIDGFATQMAVELRDV